MAKTKEKPKKESKKSELGEQGTKPEAEKVGKNAPVDRRTGDVTPKGTAGWDAKSTKKTQQDLIVENAIKEIASGKNKAFMAEVSGLLKGLSPQLEFALSKIKKA